MDGKLKDNAQLEKLIHDLYLVEYWAPLDGLPDRLRMKVFDTGVNTGIRRAVKILQKVIGAGQDGVLGPRTLALAVDSDEVLDKYCKAQADFYRSLNKPFFLKGWLRRAKWKP
jgi:lysozyme family protein